MYIFDQLESLIPALLAHVALEVKEHLIHNLVGGHHPARSALVGAQDLLLAIAIFQNNQEALASVRALVLLKGN